MNWIKSNWLIIVLSVIALAALPVMYFFSSKMNKELRVQVDKDVQADWREVTNASVTYSFPDIKKPDAKAFEKSTAVNDILTKKFASARESIKTESAQIGGEAIKFNEGGHKQLIEGLFPKPAPSERSRLMYAFVREFIEVRPKALLAGAGARGPMERTAMGKALAETKKSREERAQTVGAGLSDEEAAKLDQELLAQRVDLFRSWANQTCFYADDQIFLDVPETIPNPLPSMAKLWDWQLKTWIYDDIFKALALANSTSGGGGDGTVLTGAVKRLSKIQVEAMDYIDTPDEFADTMPPNETTVAQKDPVTPDVALSITGRYSGPRSGNFYYDLRTVTLEMIVAPGRLSALYDALTRTNYMTVLSCELTAFEPDDDLKKGYYYGDDHVVKATLKVETIWLRAWTKQYMPRAVRVSLGIPDDPAPAPAEGQPPQ